jgi:hypothetical protein
MNSWCRVISQCPFWHPACSVISYVCHESDAVNPCRILQDRIQDFRPLRNLISNPELEFHTKRALRGEDDRVSALHAHTCLLKGRHPGPSARSLRGTLLGWRQRFDFGRGSGNGVELPDDGSIDRYTDLVLPNLADPYDPGSMPSGEHTTSAAVCIVADIRSASISYRASSSS